MVLIQGDSEGYASYGVFGTGKPFTMPSPNRDGTDVPVNCMGVWGLLGTADEIALIVEQLLGNYDMPVSAAIGGCNGLLDGGFAVYGEWRPPSPDPNYLPYRTVYGFLAGNDPKFNQPVGVYGESNSQGVIGVGNGSGTGVFGTGNFGVRGESSSTNGAGITGVGKTAGRFFGDVEINGDTRVTGDVILVNNPSGADCSEDFDIEDSAETITPGTVLVIGNDGKLTVSNEEYDTRIAGVVSGAGNFRPAIVLHRINSKQRRMPIALIGKTFCKVDAIFAPIRPGDLLTTAHTLGHAMKVIDRTKAIGAILGKAMDGLENGQGLIPIMVSLR